MLNSKTLCCCLILVLGLSTASRISRSQQAANKDKNIWSAWSSCSRSCDGGITWRHRCSNHSSEGGPCLPQGLRESQHKICNMHSCPEASEADQDHCVQHNDVQHQGHYYHWEAFVHEQEPCALWCRATEDPTIEIRIKPKAVDGLRCSLDSLSVCLDGQCQAVGCDLIVGSKQKVDSCGICGGHDQCSDSGPTGLGLVFAWTEVALSHCSAPCGGGYRMARSVCQNNVKQTTVQDDFCNLSTKPASRMAPCNSDPCPARWEVEDWQPCSQSCGGGTKTRVIKCIIDRDGGKVSVPDEKCPGMKPPPRETCNIGNCPQWYTGIWSECNVKCGQGLQHRNVICRDGSGYPSTACDFAMKPASRQPCTGLICNEVGEGYSEDGGSLIEAARQKKTAPSEKEDVQASEGADLSTGNGKSKVTTGWMKLDSGILRPPRPGPAVVGTTMEQTNRTSSSSSTAETSAATGLAKEASIAVINSTTETEMTSTRFLPVPPPVIPSEPTFIVEEWGDCSSPCGEGIRERKVECKIFLEFSKTVAVLPDHECPGPKPPLTEICFSGLCQAGVNGQLLPPVMQPLTVEVNNVQKDDQGVVPHRLKMDNAIPDASVYKWKDMGFTTCSESCLGGLQESKIICVDRDGDAVSPMHCAEMERPDMVVRTCNDHPCPPRWNVSDFSTCSKTCGGGIQTRSVTCIQEVRHGGNNILRVDDSFCPQPPPITQQFCSVVDCPVKWKTGPWSKCSKKCGGGHKVRDVVCQQSLALGELANKPDRDCPPVKPDYRKACNSQPCLFSDPSHNYKSDVASRPIIKANLNQIYEQTNINQHTVRLKIGGQATVFKGTKLKVRCPVKKFDRSAIQWAKGDQLIPSGGKKKTRKRNTAGGINAFVTRKGSLRIPGIGYQDAGIYTCMAESASAQINIIVKPRDSNNVLPEENTNEFSIPAHNGWQPDYEKNLIKSQDNNRVYGHVVKHGQDDYSYGAVTPNSWSDDKLHMRFNEVGQTSTTERPYWKNNAIDDLDGYSDRNKNHLRFNEIDDNGKTWVGNNQDYNGLDWEPFGDTDYPNNQAKPKVNNMWNKRHLEGSMMKNPPDYVDIIASEEPSIAEAKTKIIEQETNNDLSLEWITSDWSKCSQTCGENGTQIRSVECTLLRSPEDKQEIIPYQICVDSGLQPPVAIQSCGLSQCPSWTAQSWIPCPKAKCIAKRTGFQTRDVFCAVADKTVDDKYCEAVLRPRSTQKCRNRRCKGIWKTGLWSQCNVRCGVGHRQRSVECVWKHTGQQAGDLCRTRSLPNAIEQCSAQPCTTTPKILVSTTVKAHDDENSCVGDSSKYCGLIVSFKMCHKDKYKKQCCASCDGA